MHGYNWPINWTRTRRLGGSSPRSGCWPQCCSSTLAPSGWYRSCLAWTRAAVSNNTIFGHVKQRECHGLAVICARTSVSAWKKMQSPASISARTSGCLCLAASTLLAVAPNCSISAHQIARQCWQTRSGSGPAHVSHTAKSRSRNLAKVAPKDNFQLGPKLETGPSRRKTPDPTWIAKLPPAASLGQNAAAHPASADAMAPIWIANVSSNSPRRSPSA